MKLAISLGRYSIKFNNKMSPRVVWVLRVPTLFLAYSELLIRLAVVTTIGEIWGAARMFEISFVKDIAPTKFLD